ncbi:hypothetical protein CYMTET_26475 [Cymbomonas tetramitiformis]|uniref:Uncharacterized protein n=1 Tax=Cymbomonas tetramitiformis TaxID=36881 RepID=A0AAE0FRQ7_9CHLO|nr:hypothetical protein CYMTET_26475 [Cymbomonas tetramitiformis]
MKRVGCAAYEARASTVFNSDLKFSAQTTHHREACSFFTKIRRARVCVRSRRFSRLPAIFLAKATASESDSYAKSGSPHFETYVRQNLDRDAYEKQIYHEGVYCNPVSGNIAAILSSCPTLISKTAWYSPPSFLSNGHLMTIWAALARRDTEITYRRELLPTPDGGTLALDHVEGHEHTEGSPWLLLLTGLGGSSQDGYVKSMAMAAAQRGMGVTVLNSRGCGGVALTSPRLFSAKRGSTEDLRTALAALRTRSDSDLVAVAWSNGSSVLINTLGEDGASSMLSGVLDSMCKLAAHPQARRKGALNGAAAGFYRKGEL